MPSPGRRTKLASSSRRLEPSMRKLFATSIQIQRDAIPLPRCHGAGDRFGAGRIGRCISEYFTRPGTNGLL
jgi:hypothetical protein